MNLITSPRIKKNWELKKMCDDDAQALLKGDESGHH